MSQTFQRKVTLGRLSWRLGLNGLSIWTDELSMKDPDGKPFIVAGESEIGIAFQALLRKKVILKHVTFHHPEVFATQVGPGKWNFSDLLVEGPEIHYVEVDDGVLHLRNQITDKQLADNAKPSLFANTQWQAYDFQSVSLKLIFPKKWSKRAWPFYLSFKLPRENGNEKYVTGVRLTALLNGKLEEWPTQKCKLEVQADDVNPEDWRAFLKVPASINARFAFKFKGEGVPKEGLAGDLSGTARAVILKQQGETVFTAPESKFTGELALSGSKLSWNKLLLSVAGVGLEANGEVANWDSPNPTYLTAITAKLSDPKGSTKSPLLAFLPDFSNKKQPTKPAGSTAVQFTFTGDGLHHNMTTSLLAEGIQVPGLTSINEKHGAQFLSLFNVEPDKPIKGCVAVQADKTIALKDIQIPVNGTVLKVNGFINADKKEHDVLVAAANLPLQKFDASQLNGEQSSSVLLTGLVDLNAHLKSDTDGPKVNVKATLKNASLGTDKTALATALKGNVEFDGRTVKLIKMSGSLAGEHGDKGSLTLDGHVPTQGNGDCSLQLVGRTVSLEKLLAFAQSAQLPVSKGAVAGLSGSAKRIDIKITGSTLHPEVALHLVPDDLAYQTTTNAGTRLKPLKITGGDIVLSNNELDLRELTVSGQTGKLTVSGNFIGTAGQVSPKLVQIKTNGVDLGELEQYLLSRELATDTHAALISLLAPLNIRSCQGKVSGDLSIRTVKSNTGADVCQTSGNIAFMNLSGKASDKLVPFDHLNGLATISSSQVALHDIAFNLGTSQCLVQGEIKAYQQAPVWNLRVTGSILPQDVFAFLPDNVTRNLSITANSAPNVRASIVGDQQSSRLLLTAVVDPADHLKISGGLGDLYQPKNLTVTCDSSIVVRSGTTNSVQLDSCRIAVGKSTITASGKCEWIDDHQTPNVEFIVTAPHPVPASVVVSSLMPEVDLQGAAGTIKGTIAMAGPVDKLLTHGDFVLARVSVPSLGIKDADGKVNSPRWSVGSDSTRGTAAASQLQVKLNSLTFAGADVRDMSGTLTSSTNSQGQPILAISDGVASVAGGHINLGLSYEPKEQKWHMDLALVKMQADRFLTDLIEHSGELTGLADGEMAIDTSGNSWTQLVSNMKGSGKIDVSKGSVPRVGQLQEKLTQANLIQQGIFGFNFNNVFQTMMPLKSGKFDRASMAFDIANGTVVFNSLTFDGNDLRLRAAGNWNILGNSVNMDVAGNIPRVASSILPGAVGEVSRNFTIQKVVRVITFRKLANLPSVPILGDIAADDPRAFVFRVAGSLDAPDAVSQSMSKTFKWLPNKPNASAHPLPGISTI